MLQHPEIGWMERTGYPSWLQERGGLERRKPYEQTQIPMGIRLLEAARADQQLRKAQLSAPGAAGGQDPDLSSG